MMNMLSVRYLSSRVSMKTKHSPQCILTDGLWTVDLVPQDENGYVGDGFIC